MENGVDCRGHNWRRNNTQMSPEKDLTGKRFGKLFVVFRVDNTRQGDSRWLCQCDCGNQVVVKGVSLRSDHSKSCGCMQKELASKALRHDIEIGTQFEYLTVIERAEGYMGKGSYWRVRCRCGTEKVVAAQPLLNGATTSCGCRNRELVSQKQLINIIGEKRGMLTILSGPVYKKKGELYWAALCDCGKSAVISGHGFKRGDITSCGCNASSSGENIIANILDNANISYIKEYSFDDLVGDYGCKLRYDFAIVNSYGQVIRLVEFDGRQHYQPTPLFGGVDAFEKLQRYDKIKNEYAISHNIPLVRIPYRRQSSLCLDDLCGKEFLIA